MNFSRNPAKPPPIIKKRTILVPKGTSRLAQSTKPSSNPRSAVENPSKTTPASITKATRTPLPANKPLQKTLLDLYLEGRLNMQGLTDREREQSVSPKEIEKFDLTSLYGAREDAVEQLHASNALAASQQPLSPLRQAAGTSPYDLGDDSGEDDGEMFGWAANEIPFPAPREETPHATPRLLVSLPLPQGFTPTNTAPTATALPARKTANRPAAPPGIPTNAVYAVESRPIPQAVQAVVDEIRLRAVKKINKAGFPQRVDLRTLTSGMSDLDRRYGYVTAGSELIKHYGDLRLFDEATWKYLVTWGKAT